MKPTFLPLFLLIITCCNFGDPQAPATLDQVIALNIEKTTPAAGTIDVPINTTVDVIFNQPIDADSVAVGDVRLYSGVMEFLGKIQIDLLDRRLRFIPSRSLPPQLRMQMYISNAIRSLNRAQFAEPLIFDFTTGEQTDLTITPVPSENDEPSSTAEKLQPIWDAHCTSCHGAAPGAAGVELSSAQATRKSLIKVPSNDWYLDRVNPYHHERSYLLRKLLDHGGFLGKAMPLGQARLSDQELRSLIFWIDEGAN